ncbi:LppX_LprAFG lipoprotein [Actinokineospora bangkokensis]|uniref:LppX_LprAFG lipoprotein n=1 Tax=Actinokineospora bangkokensis TaxID=1193682 RepID=A0A1Q9LDX2_9PSEU|nr:LppX_LprAFG lipoprotein [Actinokineospora bangkokensis]OLR90205.1 hypothetical protein BJP25_04410 [Actinokineospora bangkokensis]
MAMRLRLLVGVCALAVVAGGCTSEGDAPAGGAGLPDGKALLSGAAQETRKIETAHFSIQVNGSISGIPVQNAEGDINREQGAQGSVKLTAFGQLIEGKFVLTKDDLYLQGPTGGYQKLSAGLVTSIYDPTAILDPEGGVAKVLDSVQDPRTTGQDDDGYKVHGRVAKDAITDVVPGVNQDVELDVWVDPSSKRPTKAQVQVPQGDQTATVDLRISDVGKPVTISAPN